MYRVSVMYPYKEGARFDMDYYRATHMKMVGEILGPYGLVKTGVDQGIPTADGAPPLYVCAGHLYFESAEGYAKGIAEAGAPLRADLPNYTDITPVRQFSEILDD